MRNEMKLEFPSQSINEGFARMAIASFLTPLDPTLDELADVKTAVSEAVTNAIIHGYKEFGGNVVLSASIREDWLTVTVEDFGQGISDIEEARRPLFTTGDEQERSGMGFTVMESFMDTLSVWSVPMHGTRVTMKKHLH